MSESPQSSDRQTWSDTPPDASGTAQSGSEPRTDPVPADEPEADFTHYVHLADGRVEKVDLSAHDAAPLGTHFEEKQGEGDDAEVKRTQIVGVYPR